MKSILFLIVILMATCLISAIDLSAANEYRKGWIINSNGDTLKGFIKYRKDDKLAELCSFKASKDNQETEYKPSEIKEYSFLNKGRKFIQGIYLNQNIFFEILNQGKISLYYYKDESQKDYFFIQKKGLKNKVILPFKREYKKNMNGYVINSMTNKSTIHIDTLKKYMNDAPEIYPDIELINIPAKANLSKLVIQYNTIFGEMYVSLKPQQVIKPLGIYFSPGVIYSTSKINEMSKYTLFGGFNVSLHLFKNNDHFFVNSGAFLVHFSDWVAFNDKVQVLIDDSFFRIPLKIEYRLPVKTIQPRFNIGYNLYNSHLGTFILSSLSGGVNVNLSSYFVISILPEIEFRGINNFSMLPNEFKSFNLSAGLEIKL